MWPLAQIAFLIFFSFVLINSASSLPQNMLFLCYFEINNWFSYIDVTEVESAVKTRYVKAETAFVESAIRIWRLLSWTEVGFP